MKVRDIRKGWVTYSLNCLNANPLRTAVIGYNKLLYMHIKISQCKSLPYLIPLLNFSLLLQFLLPLANQDVGPSSSNAISETHNIATTSITSAWADSRSLPIMNDFFYRLTHSSYHEQFRLAILLYFLFFIICYIIHN